MRAQRQPPQTDSIMAFPDITAALRKAMPDLRGTLAANVPRAPLTWFKTGGPAQVLFEPADEADLAVFLQRLDFVPQCQALALVGNLIMGDLASKKFQSV